MIDEIKSFKIIEGSELVSPRNSPELDSYTGWIYLREDDKFGIILFVDSIIQEGRYRKLNSSKVSAGNKLSLHDLDKVEISFKSHRLSLYNSDILYKLTDIDNPIAQPKIRWYNKGRFSKFEG